MLYVRREETLDVGAGTHIFEWFTPAKLNEHRLYFTCAASAAACVAFYFMAGNFGLYYLQTANDPAVAGCLQSAGSRAISPTALTQWMTAKKVCNLRRPSCTINISSI